ncbi:MAG: aminotransferase class V-fold PLP-dependent enzyme [Gemmatimonadetes bacterium]|nr:aminotransferase class V-fold PLP-dependent enzyme [Gemmatimonadota bacterium]
MPPPAADGAIVASGDDAPFLAWRTRELARVEAAGLTYLDYTGAALYPESLVRADADRLTRVVLGNPHSLHGPSTDASRDLDAAREAILGFLNGSPAEYAVVLTQNASAACRLVGEAFPFGETSTFALTADNHNSINGLREWARRGGARVCVLPLDPSLRLDDPVGRLPVAMGPSLLAFPAQSNFSGVRHALSLVDDARRRGWSVLLDAASVLATGSLDLSQVSPDFICLSLYKIAGYPAGVGALVARHEALARLRRPWFAGGTVDWVSVANERHQLTAGAHGFEDGTPAFGAAGAVALALDTMRAADRPAWACHVLTLTARLLAGFADLTHANGAPRVRVHGPSTVVDRGGTVAFSVLTSAGEPVPYWDVEARARDAGIALRGGCFCNPGCAEVAFGLSEARVTACLDALGDRFTVPALAACLDGRPVGALRASLGIGSIARDVDRLLAFLAADA